MQHSQRWEYTQVSLSGFDEFERDYVWRIDHENLFSRSNILGVLNHMAQFGWEIVGDPNVVKDTLFFRRPLSSIDVPS